MRSASTAHERRLIVSSASVTRSVAYRTAAALLAAVLFSSGCGLGVQHTSQPNTSAFNNWKAVMRLDPGSHLEVDEFSGAATSGKLVSVEQNQLTIGTRIVLRSHIRRILVNHEHFGDSAVKGLALGALAGGIAGALVVPGHPVLGAAVLATLFGVKLGFAGLIVSGAIDEPDRVLVYYSDAGSPPRRVP